MMICFYTYTYKHTCLSHCTYKDTYKIGAGNSPEQMKKNLFNIMRKRIALCVNPSSGKRPNSLGQMISDDGIKYLDLGAPIHQPT